MARVKLLSRIIKNAAACEITLENPAILPTSESSYRQLYSTLRIVIKSVRGGLALTLLICKYGNVYD